MMTLVSVNVSRPKTIRTPAGSFRTGIYKMPVQGRIRVGRLNLEGDGQADLRVHGGEDKAVYVYPLEHYRFWERELSREAPFPPGQFGENLTVQGMLEEKVRIGDRYRIGTALFEVSQPRTPCHKLAFKMDRPDFPEKFIASGRSGFYLRVLEEGEVGAGDPIERLGRDPSSMSVREIFDLGLREIGDPDSLRRAARIPSLSSGWRQRFRNRAPGVAEDSGS